MSHCSLKLLFTLTFPDMREPCFEYKHPEYYVAPQEKYPKRQPFNM